MNSLFLEEILQLAASVDPALSATHPGHFMLVESVEEKIRLTGCSNHKSGTERREAGDPTSTRSFGIFTGRGRGLEPLLAVLKPIEDYIFESLDAVPFFSHGRPALMDSSTRAGDRGKLSSNFPTRYARNLGFEWGPLVNTHNVFEQSAEYVMFVEDDDEGTIVQVALANASEATASPEASAGGPSERLPASTTIISIPRSTHHMRRP
ncbi:MAG: hypothetical protein Q9175_002808 [Cornicularia normoerica]